MVALLVEIEIRCFAGDSAEAIGNGKLLHSVEQILWIELGRKPKSWKSFLFNKEQSVGGGSADGISSTRLISTVI
jgi:hypothetical protein